MRLNIEDPGDGTREIGDFEFWLSEDLGDFLVKHAFEEEYKSAFDARKTRSVWRFTEK
ncbi:hypothetical protein [Paucisalibacillus globulus]|uniref:hypothetical protein n=1 Tax=Paucisalibacillus globulus TaxID=351095 RepID=UPI00041D706B|nr:hypothetical protein [Paucisalibacillus globulus]